MGRKKVHYFILFLSIFNTVSAQKFIYPSFKDSENKWQDFIPAGWEILDTAIGDLNKDGWKDVAMVLKPVSPFYYTEKVNEEITDTIKSIPRIILLTFYNKSVKKFYKILTDTSIIPANDSAFNGEEFRINNSEPLNRMYIEKGVLIIHVVNSTSATRQMSYYIYKFRYQKNQMQLIGATASFHGGDGYQETWYDFNFSTGKFQKAGYDYYPGKELKTINGRFKNPAIHTLNHWKSFEVIKGVWI